MKNAATDSNLHARLLVIVWFHISNFNSPDLPLSYLDHYKFL